jgi:hypothetical protein
MATPPHSLDYASAPSPRRPLTNLRVTLWLLVFFATVFVVSRWLVPWEIKHVIVPYPTRAAMPRLHLIASRHLGTVASASVMAVLTLILPMLFVRLAWTPDRPDRYAYRRLVAIHLITCALLTYLLIVVSALYLCLRSMLPPIYK